MHIPDGYLSPSTCLATAAIAVPAWAVAGHRLRNRLHERQAPLLAAGASFCFAVMMLNVPIPGGTTAHAVGGTLVAVVLGPEAAILALTTTLVIQALFFGDGGILALGANSLNMAVILPVAGYAVYSALSRAVPTDRHASCLTAFGSRFLLPAPWAAAAGAYVGINLAALAAGIELGLQPLLFHTPSGTPLYCPYGLKQTIPAMMLAHLTVAGGVEAVVTGLAVAYILRASPSLLRGAEGAEPVSATWAWRGVAVLAVLAPLGLLAPGSAFGEWSAEELKKTIGFVPPGLERFGGAWRHALLPDYNLPGGSDSLGFQQATGYWLSAFAGILALTAGITLIARTLSRRHSNPSDIHRTPLAPEDGRNSRKESPGKPFVSEHPDSQIPNPERESPIPSWLLAPMPDASSLALCGKRQRRSFVDKTLGDAASIVQGAFFTETITGLPGILQRLDPRVKIVSAAALLLTACSIHRPEILAAMLASSLALGLASRVPVSMLTVRLWVIPVFTLFAALPATLNWVTPGDAMIVLARFPPAARLAGFPIPGTLTITSQGLETVCILLLRVATSMTIVLLLTLTTRWSHVLRALRALAVPRLFVFVLSLVYRYMFLLLQTAGDMFMARKSRSFAEPDTASGRRFVAITIASMLSKSHSLSEEVHAAMVSRGYTGEPRNLTDWRFTALDALWTAACIIAAAGFWIGDRLLG